MWASNGITVLALLIGRCTAGDAVASAFRDTLFLSVSRHSIKLPDLEFCSGGHSIAANNISTKSGTPLIDSQPVNDTCEFWRSYYEDPVNKAKTGVYTQKPSGLATQGAVHAEWLGRMLHEYLRVEAPDLVLSKFGVAAHDESGHEARVIATAESVAKGFTQNNSTVIFKSATLDSVLDEGSFNAKNSDTIPKACRLANQGEIEAQLGEQNISDYFFSDSNAPVGYNYSVVGLGKICTQLDLACHIRTLRRRLASLSERVKESIRRRLSTLVLDSLEGKKLLPTWGGGYWTTYAQGLPSVDSKYISMLLVQRLVGGNDKACTDPTKAAAFECDWAQLASAQSGYDRLNNLYDGVANLNRFSGPSLVATVLAHMEAKMEAKMNSARAAGGNSTGVGTDDAFGARHEPAQTTPRDEVVAQTLPGDADVKMLFGHDVQVQFVRVLLIAHTLH
jgi:hypothetical protein